MDQHRDSETVRFIAKRLPSRERIETLRAIIMLADDGDSFMDIVENLLDIRQRVNGGRREVRGSRHWPSD